MLDVDYIAHTYSATLSDRKRRPCTICPVLGRILTSSSAASCPTGSGPLNLTFFPLVASHILALPDLPPDRLDPGSPIAPPFSMSMPRRLGRGLRPSVGELTRSEEAAGGVGKYRLRAASQLIPARTPNGPAAAISSCDHGLVLLLMIGGISRGSPVLSTSRGHACQ